MDKKKITIETYNRTAVEMAQKFNQIGTRVSDIEHVLSLVDKKNPKILEIGCGNGRDAAEIIKHTENYLGIDVSSEMIRLAREAVPNARFSVADSEMYEFESSIDVIFAFASLLHTPRETLKIIFDRAYTALNPGGVFFISVKYGPYQEIAKQDEFGERYFYLYTPDDLLAAAGPRYKALSQTITNVREQKWVEIILQK